MILTSVILNYLEWRNSPSFAFFSPNLIALLPSYVTVVEDRPIMSVNIVSGVDLSSELGGEMPKASRASVPLPLSLIHI